MNQKIRWTQIYFKHNRNYTLFFVRCFFLSKFFFLVCEFFYKFRNLYEENFSRRIYQHMYLESKYVSKLEIPLLADDFESEKFDAGFFLSRIVATQRRNVSLIFYTRNIFPDGFHRFDAPTLAPHWPRGKGFPQNKSVAGALAPVRL